MALRLNIEEDGKRRAVALSGAELTIGRGSENGIVIGDPRSSRQHCRIVRTPQGILLEDMASRNGTLLNGAAVTKSFVKVGDEFRVGNVRFVLEDRTEPAQGVGAEPQEDDGDLLIEELAGEASPAPSPERLADTKLGSRTGVASPRKASAPARAAPEREETAPPAGLELEGVEGSHAGTRITVDRTPFVIGRSRDCELPIDDKRASGKHARILRSGAQYHVEDLGSTNGTLLNRRPIQRAAITQGALIQIGNTSFRALTSGAAALAGAPATRGAPPPEEFVDFDVEKFLARDRAQHPLAVAALLLILGVVGYFTVDIAMRLGRKDDPDPSPAGNLVSSNWSFEDAPAAVAAAAVPGWRVAEGDEGRIEATDSHAQVPGRRALRLRSTGAKGLCRAAHQTDIILPQERRYRIEGFVLNEGAYAAGIVIEWLRASREGDSVVVERSYSDTARQSSEALDVDQPVTAPSYATQARVCVFVLGEGGSAVFDRIRFAPAEAAPVEPAKDGEGGDGKERAGARRLLVGGDRGAFHMTIEDDGTVALERAKKAIAASIWCGLDPERDPLGFGPRLALARASPGDGDAILLNGEIPDAVERRWVLLETVAARAGNDAVLRFRTASEGNFPAELSLYIDTREPWISVPSSEAAADEGVKAPGRAAATREIVLGEKAERISISFASDVTVEERPHPVQPSRKVLRAAAGGPAIEATLSSGSRHGSSLARAHVERAEEEFRAGRVGAAIAALSRMGELFPDEKAEARKAATRVTEWRGLAAEALASLEKEIAVLKETPSQVVRDIVAKRAAALKGRFEGTPEADKAAMLIAEVEGTWSGLASKQKKEEVSSHYEKARRHFAAGELGLAELYFQWVADADPDGEMGKSARNQIKIIHGRRARDVKILLQ
jgi:pSer/pThr/pTyr-binding forkhead associated (FHA) protein